MVTTHIGAGLPPGPRERFKAHAPLAVIVAIGLFVRLAGLDRYYWTGDDCIMIMTASFERWRDIWGSALNNMHPPLKFFVLHYMLKISDNPVWLRMFGIVPSVFTTVFLYELARRRGGLLAAVFAGTFSSLGYGNLLFSQTMRNYSATIALISAAMLCLDGFRREGKYFYLAGYSALLLIGEFTHFSMIMAGVAMGVVLLADLIGERMGWREWLAAALAHVPAIAGGAVLLVFQIIPLMTTWQWRNRAGKGGYLNAYFITDLDSAIENILGMAGYLFHPLLPRLFLALVILGAAVLVRRRRFAFVIAWGALFSINLALNLAGKYPLGALRQCAHHFPFMVVLAAVGLEATLRSAGGVAARIVPAAGKLGAPALGRPAIAATVLALIINGAAAMAYRPSDYCRRLNGMSYIEFPLVTENVKFMLEKLKHSHRPGDLVITNCKTGLQITRLARPGSISVFARVYPPDRYLDRDRDRSFHVEYGGMDFRFAPDWEFKSEAALFNYLGYLEERGHLPEEDAVWLLNMGLGPLENVMWGPGARELVVEVGHRGRSSLRKLDADKIREELEKRKRENPAEK